MDALNICEGVRTVTMGTAAPQVGTKCDAIRVWGSDGWVFEWAAAGETLQWVA